jgi:hypothetical protein
MRRRILYVNYERFRSQWEMTHSRCRISNPYRLMTMKRIRLSLGALIAGPCLLFLVAGCSTTGDAPSAEGKIAPTRYRAEDGRIVTVGARQLTENGEGWNFKGPHLDKAWLAKDFDFSGYDTLYLAPIRSTATYHPDEERPHALAKENLAIELKHFIASRGMFTNVVSSESEISPGARVLKLENTIVEYTKGGGAARYWAGAYGAGQPAVRVEGRMTDGDKPVFTYAARRSGVSSSSRMIGGFLKDEDIQLKDIRSLTLDLSDFMAAVAGKYPPKN